MQSSTTPPSQPLKTKIKLFESERYPVIIGKGVGSALCTCWTLPELLLRNNPSLQERFELIGTLYGVEGVSVMLRNLCLNPHIRTLFVLTDSPLSKTAFGASGWKNLESLWQNGLDGNTVRGTGSRIHKELDPKVIEKVRQNVRLVKVDNLQIINVQHTGSAPYMEPVSFAPPSRDTAAPWPSEEVGWSVHGKTVTDAWLKAIARIMRYGTVKGTDYGNRQKELQVVTWVADCGKDWPIPSWPADIIPITGLQADAISEYEASLLKADLPPNTAYTYGQRLVDFKGINQVNAIINGILKSRHTRRAFASIPDVLQDHSHSSPPCLVYIQVSVTDRLNMFATFRSHDMFKAALPNAFALRGLCRHIAEKTGLPPGLLSITSNSAHIYEEEWEHTVHLLHAAARPFRIEEEVDPRGNVRIRTGKDIIVTLEGRDGIIEEWHGSKARALLMIICQQDVLSHPYHYADIAIELAKAELCLKLNKPYVQDRPLALEGAELE